MRSWESRSEADTERVGEELARDLSGRGILLLEGDLGSGKTVLVRGLARALGVDSREIQSPTYTLVHEHDGTRGRLVHIDLYRLEPEEVESLGLEELLAGDALVAIEWPDRLGAEPAEAWRVRIRVRRDEARRIEAQSTEEESG